MINSFSNTYCREQNDLLSRPPSSRSAINWLLFPKKKSKVIRISSSFHFYIYTSTGLCVHKLDFHSCYCQWFTQFSPSAHYTPFLAGFILPSTSPRISYSFSFLSATYRHALFSLLFLRSNTILGTFLFYLLILLYFLPECETFRNCCLSVFS